MINDQQLLSVFQQAPGMARPAAPTGPPPTPAPGQADPLLYRIPRERNTRRWGRSDADEHPWERAADELYRYEREMPEKLAAALMPTGRAPFTTSAPLTEQRDFWLERLRAPDGTINQQAVDALLAAASPAEVHQLAGSIRALSAGEEAKS